MTRTLIAASLLAVVAVGSAYAAALTEDSDIMAKGDGYKADDVECKDGQYDMTLDKDFKITGKEKED
jgi:hypothetical protein